MTIPLDIKPEVQAELARQAAAQGRPIEVIAAALLEGAVYPTAGQHPEGGQYVAFLGDLKRMAPAARSHGVTVVIKQHGGSTATGRNRARIIDGVGDEGPRICYDAGNVMDYEREDPIPHIQPCWGRVRASAIKDHRHTPRNQDRGPGLGPIDPYKLLTPVARTGLDMPPACENIFEPVAPRPARADAVDTLARAGGSLKILIRDERSIEPEG